MDILLRQIAGKPAGTYFITRDNSGVEEIQNENKLRLIFINSPKGPVNCVITFAKGDVAGFNTIFGKSSRILEKRGNYSLKTAEQMLSAGPVAVMNLRKFIDTDEVGSLGLDANVTVVEEKKIPYTQCFNTNSLWTIKPQQICDKLTSQHLLNVANVGNNDVSIFVVASDKYASLTNLGNESLFNAAKTIDIDEYPALNLDALFKDTFVDVYIFNNTFNPDTVGTNKYYGQLFDAEGNLTKENLLKLTKIAESGYSRVVTGTLIPNIKSESGDVISIDQVLNQLYSETGLIAFINDDVLESEDQNIIDFDGSSYYDETGKIKENVSPYMLSHIVPKEITKAALRFPPVAASDLEVPTAVELTYGTEKVADNEFLIAKEQGISVGDKIKGLNGALVEVIGMEIIEENVVVETQYEVKVNTVGADEGNSLVATILEDEEEQALPTDNYVTEKKTVRLILTNKTNQNFVLTVNGEIKTLTDNKFEFEVNQDTVIIGTFTTAPVKKTITVNIVKPTNGSIEVTYGTEKTPVTDGMELDENTEVTINAIPDENYEF